MSASATQTKTYSVVDIRKVVDNFAADYSMKSQSTGLNTRDQVANVVYDLTIFAEYEYLLSVELVLEDSDGDVIKGTEYTVSNQAIGWSSERPGNNLWPRTPGGVLRVTASLNSAWWSKTEASKAIFLERHKMKGSWPTATEETSFAHLSSSSGQQYSSNGYGWQRTNHG